MKRRIQLPRAFLNAVLDAAASCQNAARVQQQVTSIVIDDDDDAPPTSNDGVLSISSSTCTNVSSAASCEASAASPQDNPVTYFQILVEDVSDRLEEASKFLHETASYSFKYEFHIKILNDLYEELGNPPSHMEVEEYEMASQLRQRLRQLQLNLVEQRNLFLGYTMEHSQNVKISPLAGAEPYLRAAAEAKAARERQCRMVVLMERIADLGRQEEKYKQRRLKAEAELLRHVNELVQPDEQKDDKSEPVSSTASDPVEFYFSN